MGSGLLFVYGTLKRGQRNHVLLAGEEFVASARTVPQYRLYDCGAFPGLVHDPEHGIAIEGEIWHVSEETLQGLDDFEGVPQIFIRAAVELQESEGPVLAYLYQCDVTGLPDCGKKWPRAS